MLIIELHQLIKYREGQRGTETERRHTPLDCSAGPEIRVMMMITDNDVILNGWRTRDRNRILGDRPHLTRVEHREIHLSVLGLSWAALSLPLDRACTEQ